MPDRLILASGSPRRIELLKLCHIPFESLEHEFREESLVNSNPVRLAELLAEGKAMSIANKKEHLNDYVMGVDTIVVLKNNVLGKPKDSNEAEYFIRLLSGKKHKVISGISIININDSVNLARHSVTYVKFSKFTEQFIKYYLDNNLWLGYAGGYAIQSIFGMLTEKIKGSYTNIVGLPVEALYNLLQKINFNFLW